MKKTHGSPLVMRLNDLKGGRLRLTPCSLIISALLLIMSVACSKDDEGISEPTTIPVSSIKLNQTSITLNVGESVDLTATVSPENATNKTVAWSSSDAKIATVSNGKVTAVAVGEATITAQCGNVKAKCTITVKATEVTSIKLDQTAATLYAGETIQLTATVSPDNATDKTVIWSSSNTSVATVSNGKVTSVAVGSATITAQCGNVKAECTITVKATEVTSIKLNQTAATLYAGETIQLTATVSPKNATNKNVTWISSNTSVATVTNGKVTAVAVGKATITAQCGNVKAECTITVKATEVTSITLNKTSVTLSAGETVQLTATISPNNATDKTVTWSSSNTSVATVTNGIVTAVAAGKATITARCGNVKAECTITVKATEETPNLPATIENIAGTWLLIHEEAWDDEETWSEDFPNKDGWYMTYTFDENGTLTSRSYINNEPNAPYSHNYSISGNVLTIDQTSYEIKKLTKSQLVLSEIWEIGGDIMTFKRIE